MKPFQLSKLGINEQFNQLWFKKSQLKNGELQIYLKFNPFVKISHLVIKKTQFIKILLKNWST